jgi:hypothetical protein
LVVFFDFQDHFRLILSLPESRSKRAG